jgi:TPR repeat protein
MSRLRTITTAALLCLVGQQTSLAEDRFVDGLAAYDAGDYAATTRIWRPLAEQGDPTAQTALAGLYRSGAGVARDLAEAARLYRLAAEQGNDDAQLNLGRMYADGVGVERDPVEAYAWLSLAAEQGRAWAEQRRRQIARELTPDQQAAAARLLAERRPP